MILDLNRKALQKLSCDKKNDVIKGASYLFEEPGILEKVALISSNWFLEQFI